jgi:hypothetical protein
MHTLTSTVFEGVGYGKEWATVLKFYTGKLQQQQSREFNFGPDWSNVWYWKAQSV